jgi:hypothetical protein
MNDPMQLFAEAEHFATTALERQLIVELRDLVKGHSELKTENAKLKQDLHHYMLAANAEAELVDKLQEENRTLVRQNAIWQEENASLDRIASDLQDTCDKQAKRLTESEALLRHALDAFESLHCYEARDALGVALAIAAIRARLNLTKGS